MKFLKFSTRDGLAVYIDPSKVSGVSQKGSGGGRWEGAQILFDSEATADVADSAEFVVVKIEEAMNAVKTA